MAGSWNEKGRKVLDFGFSGDEEFFFLGNIFLGIFCGWGFFCGFFGFCWLDGWMGGRVGGSEGWGVFEAWNVFVEVFFFPLYTAKKSVLREKSQWFNSQSRFGFGGYGHVDLLDRVFSGSDCRTVYNLCELGELCGSAWWLDCRARSPYAGSQFKYHGFGHLAISRGAAVLVES